MKAVLKGVKRVSRFSSFLTRFQDRLARSSRVFLIGLVVACGVEVLVDWSTTLREVTVLRDRMRERGTSYASMLASALEKPLAETDAKEIVRLSDGLFDDDDVCFVRIVDQDGRVLHEKLAKEYDKRFLARRKKSFDDFYGHQLDRDTKGMLKDPDTLKRRIENSRHRDFAQAWNDFIDGILKKVTGVPPPRSRSTAIAYQDRLYDERKDFDGSTTYALGRIDVAHGAETRVLGVVIVALDMAPTNSQISDKYLKGLGIVVFFVGLILVQNVLSRREKLRLLALEERHQEARAALAATFPARSDANGLEVAGAVAQSKAAVDGLLWDAVEREGVWTILLVDPQGDGVDVAALSLLVRTTFRKRREEDAAWDPVAEMTALGEAVANMPLSRPVGLVLLRVSGGRVDGIASPVGGARVLAGGKAVVLDETSETAEPTGVVGPLRRLSADLPAGATLVLVSDGLAGTDKRVDVDAVVDFLRRNPGTAEQGLRERLTDAATWARGKSPALEKSDLAVIAARRGQKTAVSTAPPSAIPGRERA